MGGGLRAVLREGVGGQVRGQHPAEELTGAGRAADDAGALAVGEDRGVAGDGAAHRAHPVQGVAAGEELEVAGAGRQASGEPFAPAGEHVPHVVEVLGPRRPDVRAELEEAAVPWRLGQHAHGELVGVEVPRVALARLHDVGHQPGERVREFVQLGQREAAGDEALERPVRVEPADEGLGRDVVPGDERVAALEERAAGVVGRQVGRLGDVVDVNRLDVGVRPGASAAHSWRRTSRSSGRTKSGSTVQPSEASSRRARSTTDRPTGPARSSRGYRSVLTTRSSDVASAVPMRVLSRYGSAVVSRRRTRRTGVRPALPGRPATSGRDPTDSGAHRPTGSNSTGE